MFEHRNRTSIVAGAAAAVLLVAGVVATPHLLAQEEHQTPDTSAAVSSAMEQLSTDSLYADIYNHVSPSVVAINVTVQDQFGREGHALGSGFIYDTEGRIITNDHVVQNADSIEVAFFDGTLARATIVGQDPDSDIAVIQVEDVTACCP